MSDTSARLSLPLLQAGQAQKEVWHNEALALLDLLTQPSVVAIDAIDPPGDPQVGQLWALGSSPAGAWAGHGDQIAGWTDGGWRFAGGFDGMAVWSLADGATARLRGGHWMLDGLREDQVIIAGQRVVAARTESIADPDGGGIIDVECRQMVRAILAALRHHGLIAP